MFTPTRSTKTNANTFYSDGSFTTASTSNAVKRKLMSNDKISCLNIINNINNGDDSTVNQTIPICKISRGSEKITP